MHLADTVNDSSTMCRRSVRSRLAAMPGGSSFFETANTPLVPVQNLFSGSASPNTRSLRERTLFVGPAPRRIFPPSLYHRVCISPDSVYRAYRTGEIPGAQIARSMRLDLDQIRNAVKKIGILPSLRFIPVMSKRPQRGVQWHEA